MFYDVYLLPRVKFKLSTRDHPGYKGCMASKTDSLTTICEPIVWKIWEPRRLTILWGSTACRSNIIFT